MYLVQMPERRELLPFPRFKRTELTTLPTYYRGPHCPSQHEAHRLAALRALRQLGSVRDLLISERASHRRADPCSTYSYGPSLAAIPHLLSKYNFIMS